MADFTIERQAQRCRLVLTGNLTAAIAPALQAELRGQFDQGLNELEVDLANTVMLDSSGIGLLIASHNSLARSRGTIRVLNVSPEILQLLQTMRLVTRLNVSGRPNPGN